MPRTGAGRPSLLETNPELVDELELHIRNGNYIEVACDFAGVESGMFRAWIRRGKAELRRIAAARRALDEAERKLELPRLRGDVRRKLESELEQLEAALEPLVNERIYLDFHRRMKRAQAQGEIGALGIINRAAIGQPATEETVTQPDGTVLTRRTEAIKPAWQAAAWRLERMHPDRYARRAPQQLQLVGGGPDTPPVEVNNNISGGAEVVFLMPHNGRTATPDGARVEPAAPVPKRNADPVG